MRGDDANEEGAASGRFLLRLDPQLHAILRAEAAARRVSLNALCTRTLAEHACGPHGSPLGPIVRRALALLEDALIGVVGIGSWARGEAAGDSDVDVLLVVAPNVAITRALYRRWDAEPATVDGRVVDPHVIALPDVGGTITGVWAEAARDGIVVFERHHAVSRYLGHVRRRLAGGAHRRSTAHGQPYWVAPQPEKAHAKP